MQMQKNAKTKKYGNGLFNIDELGVVIQSLKQRLIINMPDDTDFGMKVDFCGGRKTGIEINQTQPTYEPRIEPGSQWWEVRMVTSAST